MLDNARAQQVFSREDTPTNDRVWGAFLYLAGLSYRRVEAILDHSYEVVR